MMHRRTVLGAAAGTLAATTLPRKPLAGDLSPLSSGLAPVSPPAAYTVTVMGRGRQVIGGAQHTSLSAPEVRKLLFDGFFPLTPRDAEPARGPRAGLHERVRVRRVGAAGSAVICL